MTLMTFVPTIVEFALVLGVCAYEFDWRSWSRSLAMIVLYLWFTVRATDWRIEIRRTMNESDTEANTKAIDSLLNYETVKYFGAENARPGATTIRWRPTRGPASRPTRRLPCSMPGRPRSSRSR